MTFCAGGFQVLISSLMCPHSHTLLSSCLKGDEISSAVCTTCCFQYLISFVLYSSVSPALQRRLPGAPQGDTSAFRHEEDQQAESDPEESDPAGVCGEGHTHICGEPLRRLHVLLLRNATTPLHGHGVR